MNRSAQAPWQRAWVLCAVLLFLAVSNRWFSWNEGIEYVQANDVRVYQTIAEAAPGFPAQKFAFHHMQRLPVHFAVGCFSRISGISLPSSYRLAAVLTWGLTLYFLIQALLGLGIGANGILIASSMFLLNPYALRYYAIVPGMLQDTLFHCGTAVVLLGLARGRVGLLLIGLFVASLARQTSLMLVPGLWAGCFWGEKWRGRSAPERLGILSCLLFVPAAAYLVLGELARPLSQGEMNTDAVLGIFRWIWSPEFSFSTLLEFSLRLLIPFLLPLAVVSALAQRLDHRKPVFWTLGLLCAGVSLQPLLAGPVTAGYNASRLSSLGLVFAVGAVAMVLDTGLRIFQSTGWTAIIIGLAALGSFHHLYSAVGPGTRTVFALWQISLAVVLFFALYRRQARFGAAA